jgi:hypothetical protein
MRLLREGLRPNDLEDMVHDLFEIDAFQSKMGDDRDVCVLSFRAKDRAPARDMMEFIEKGYGFVLDADVSAGEDRKGEYHVFVELSRTPELPKQIKELTDGIRRLTGIEEWKFKYYKQFKSNDLTEENVKNVVPTTASDYDMMQENIRVESIQKFFSKTYKETIVVEGNRIVIRKPFGVTVAFEMMSFGDKDDVQKDLTETMKIDTRSTAEALWLTKLLGDFNINKYGEAFVLEQGRKAMTIKMIGV